MTGTLRLGPLGGVALLIGLVTLVAPHPARATLTLTLLNEPNMGKYFSGASGRQFILRTDGSIGGADAADYLSGAIEGRFTVQDDLSPASIVILVDNITTTGGLSVSEALCSYDGGTEGSCDGAGMTETSVATATLRVGLDVSTTQAHSGGDTGSITMDVSVAYL